MPARLSVIGDMSSDPLVRVATETAHMLGAVPIVWLTCLRGSRHHVDAAWWWLAAAYGVSWIADSAAHVLPATLVSAVYPVSQAGLVGAVLLRRDAAGWLALALVAAGCIALAEGGEWPDVVLRSVAWGAVAAVAIDQPELGMLRTALLVTFFWGLVAWLLYVAHPAWSTWSVYQLVRATGAVWFCVAVRARPPLAVVRV